MSTPRSKPPARRCACPSAKTTRRRRSWRRRRGGTCDCGSKRTRTTISSSGRAQLDATTWRDDLCLLHARADRARVRADADGTRIMSAASEHDRRAAAQAGDDRRRRRGARSGLLQAPPKARACYVFAHGAGAGMTHPFMTSVAERPRRARTSPRCATSFRTWSAARSAPTRPSSRRQRYAPQWRKHARLVPGLRCSPAASPSAAA